MLLFLAILTASVASLLLVQAMDVECLNPPKARPAAGLRRAAKLASVSGVASLVGWQ